MGHARVFVAVALVCAALSTHALGCGEEVFACESAEQCGADGACEATGFCSFPDDDCASGRRYGRHAAGGIAGECVPTAPLDDGSSGGDEGPATTTGLGDDDTNALSSGRVSSGVVDETAGLSETGTTTDTVGTDDSTGTAPRVTDGLLALYRFDEGAGVLVLDQSGVDPPVDLTLEPENGSPAWVDGGLSFTGGGIAHALGSATKIRAGCQATGELSVEAWVTASVVAQDGPARLVTLSADISSRSFTLGLALDTLGEPGWAARLSTSTSDINGVPTFYAPAIVTIETTHLLFSRTTDGTVKVWVDAAESLDEFRDGDFSTWATTDQFAVGNEIDLMRPWLGVMHLVAVYDRALAPDEVAQNFAAGP